MLFTGSVVNPRNKVAGAAFILLVDFHRDLRRLSSRQLHQGTTTVVAALRAVTKHEEVVEGSLLVDE